MTEAPEDCDILEAGHLANIHQTEDNSRLGENAQRWRILALFVDTALNADGQVSLYNPDGVTEHVPQRLWGLLHPEAMPPASLDQSPYDRGDMPIYSRGPLQTPPSLQERE